MSLPFLSLLLSVLIDDAGMCFLPHEIHYVLFLRRQLVGNITHLLIGNFRVLKTVLSKKIKFNMWIKAWTVSNEVDHLQPLLLV